MSFRWQWEIDNANKFVEAVNTMDPKPKFVIMTGDFVNAHQGMFKGYSKNLDS
jgi:hypothetical protein